MNVALDNQFIYAMIVTMYVDIVPNRNSRPAILLREAWREDGKIKKRTVANISAWPLEKVEVLRKILRNDYVVSAEQANLVIESSLPHGHVAAILGMIERLGLDRLIYSKRCRERGLVLAMIAERLLHPCSKLATTRMWHTTTLAEELGVEAADEDELYEAMDWLGGRQERIERGLAQRHLQEGGLVLYDATSSYYEGRTCPLVRFGHSRDGKKGKPIIVYGVMTDGGGCPVAVEVYPGNTGDSKTVPDQVEKLRERFGLKRVVLVGDRGMLAETQLEVLKGYPGLGWVTALRSQAIRQLVGQGLIQPSLFDQRNLAEISSPDYPGERLIVCFNPFLQEERKRKREELLSETEKRLSRIAGEVARRTKTPLAAAEIGRKVGAVLNRYKVGKHFRLTIKDGVFRFERDEDAISGEAALDGFYVIRTSEPKERLSPEDAVRAYKGLSAVERLFRTLKGIDILVRPIHHRGEERVKAHIFICLLAYYVEWHMRQALAPLLFDDEDKDKKRDPVALAQPSPQAKEKKSRKKTRDGLPIHSFDTLLAELGTLCRNRCRMGISKNLPTFVRVTEKTTFQKKIFELLEM